MKQFINIKENRNHFNLENIRDVLQKIVRLLFSQKPTSTDLLKKEHHNKDRYEYLSNSFTEI